MLEFLRLFRGALIYLLSQVYKCVPWQFRVICLGSPPGLAPGPTPYEGAALLLKLRAIVVPPAWIRTCDLSLTRTLLYLAELRRLMPTVSSFE